jgi:Uma2 family endonuclease
MTSVVASGKMSAEEFADWVQRPENRNRWFELVRGEVIELPPPMKIHGRVCMNVAFVLESYVRQRRKGYVTINDAGVILERGPDTVRGPDVALYEDAGRFSELHPKYGEVAPRLAVEVLSPSDTARQATRKITDYLEAGVELVWQVDPEDRSVTVYRRDRGPVRFGEQGELSAEDLLPGLRCSVASLFLLPEEMPG